MIEFRNVTFAHPGRDPILNGFSFRLEPGLTHALIGPSGCGKTPLLYLAAGLHAPCAGEVLVAGEPVRPGRRETAVILQDHGLFPWKTVRSNLELGLRLRGVSAPERRALADRALSETAMEGHDGKYPRQLSGGERQRLAIARALVLEPDLLLLDEPFSALDAMTRERLQNRLAELAGSSRGEGGSAKARALEGPGTETAGRPMTLLVVTHDLAEAAFLADRIHVMGDGKDGIALTSLDNPLRAGRAAGVAGEHAPERPGNPAGEPSPRRLDAGLRASPLFHETCARVRALLSGAAE